MDGGRQNPQTTSSRENLPPVRLDTRLARLATRPIHLDAPIKCVVEPLSVMGKPLCLERAFSNLIDHSVLTPLLSRPSLVGATGNPAQVAPMLRELQPDLMVLDISHNTVKLHVRHIMDKLNLRSRVEAAVFAFEYRSSPAGVAQKGQNATPGH